MTIQNGGWLIFRTTGASKASIPDNPAGDYHPTGPQVAQKRHLCLFWTIDKCRRRLVGDPPVTGGGEGGYDFGRTP
jgi:hypothetical protein